jgi:DNA-binding response OmpR family regulator
MSGTGPSAAHIATDLRSERTTVPVRVLVVDDEQPILDLVRGYLEREGWTVVTAADGDAALERASVDHPDVVVLDLMLPGLDGIEVCRRLRAFSDAYVIMLTAKSEEVDKLVGLAIGADDYLTKPFSPRELVSRIRAMLRRPRAASGAVSAVLEVDVARRQVRAGDRPVELTRTEFDILAMLAREPGVVVDRPSLLAAVWGPGYDDDHLVDVHVANLRRKLDDDPERPRFVETIRGVGYRLVTRR